MLTSPRVIRFTQYAIIYAVLGLGSFLILFPLAWAATSALKPNTEVFAVPMNWIPENPLWENFILPFREKAFGTYFLNSIIAALASVALTVVISASPVSASPSTAISGAISRFSPSSAQ